MGFGVLPLSACAAVLAGWTALAACHYRAQTRRRRERAEWARLTEAEWARLTEAEWARLTESVSGLAELDADLDRTWGNEQEWIRRYR